MINPEINTPAISIIVPCYNVERYVGKCLKSILEQTFTDIEVIAINDASTDGTLAILQEYAAKDDRLSIIDLPVNGGLANGRRVGLGHVHGEYIAFVDSDDYISRDFIDTLWQHRCENGIVQATGSTSVFKFLQLKRGRKPKETSISGKQLEERTLGFFGMSLIYGATWGKLYHKSILLPIDYPVINIFFQEDVLLNLYTWPRVKRINFVENYGYHYRDGGGSGKVSQRYIDDFRELYNIKKATIREWNYGHNALDYTKIELKNCLYVYLKRLIERGDDKAAVMVAIRSELKHPEYVECCQLSDDFAQLLTAPDYAALIAQDVDAIYAQAHQLSRQRRLLRLLKRLI